eukprot:jgi/Ulvmu1/255/UM001_0259.1
MSSDSKECVKVVVRCRPLNTKEKSDGRKTVVGMDIREGQVHVYNPKAGTEEPAKTFTYDQVYDWNSQQLELFSITAKPIVDSVMAGYNGTIFAYGQTGTGKTFTMEGVDDATKPELRGIMLNVFDFIFDQIQDDSEHQREYLVYISYLEIYNEEIRDLLAKDSEKLQLKEAADKGVYVKGLKKVVVKSAIEMQSHLNMGKKQRHVGATAMNADSSRSHSIFTIYVECKHSGPQGQQGIHVGKLNLVDLAGSERQSKTQASGSRLNEGIKINLSLTALGNVIEALVAAGDRHVPYRDSKLTRLLQDSLGGNTKTVMVANIGPADWNHDETMSTLRYANRAKNIKNKPTKNEDPKDAMLRDMQQEMERLRAMLEGNQAPDAEGGALAREEGVEAVRRQMQEEILNKMQKDRSAGAVERVKVDAEAKARMQLEAIMTEAGSTAQQKEAAMRQLAEQHEQIEKYAQAVEQEMENKTKIEQKLKSLEKRVLHGGENMVEKMSNLKKLAKATKAELEVQRRQQEELARRMKEMDKEDMEFEEHVGSLKEQAQQYTQKLKKLYASYQTKKSEREGLRKEFQAEKEEILDGIREMTRDIKLKDLIIAAFIPPIFQEKIVQHAEWDEYESSWAIGAMEYAGNALRAQRDMAVAQQAHIKATYGDPDPAVEQDDVFFTYQEVEELQKPQAQGHSGRLQSGRRKVKA